MVEEIVRPNAEAQLVFALNLFFNRLGRGWLGRSLTQISLHYRHDASAGRKAV